MKVLGAGLRLYYGWGILVVLLRKKIFSADAVSITVKTRVSMLTPDLQRGKMESAIKIIGAIIDNLKPKDKLSLETTQDMEGFVHPTSISGGLEQAKHCNL